jgi:hypothetical protein
MAKRTDEKPGLTEGMFIVPFNVIRKFFETLASIDPECRIHIGKDGIYALVVDCQNREMIQICLDKFKTMIPPKEMTFCLDVSAINTVLKTNPPGEDATVRWNDSHIEIETGRVKLSFDFLDDRTVKKDPTPPTLQAGTTSFKVLGSVLLQGLRIASAQSDIIWLTTTRDSAFLQWRGDRSKSEYALASCQVSPEKAKYSYDALESISKIMVNAEITVTFKSDYVIKMTANDKGGLPEGLAIIYLLAPRIESD